MFKYLILWFYKCLFIHLYVCMLACIYASYVCWCLQKPGVLNHLKLELQEVMNCLMWVMRTKPMFSAGTASARGLCLNSNTMTIDLQFCPKNFVFALISAVLRWKLNLETGIQLSALSIITILYVSE